MNPSVATTKHERGRESFDRSVFFHAYGAPHFKVFRPILCGGGGEGWGLGTQGGTGPQKRRLYANAKEKAACG